MSVSLPYDESNFDRIDKLEESLNTSDDVGFGYFIEVDLKSRYYKK